MKLIKKLLSGAMALTMAASMTLTTAVQAGAETMSDGSHNYTVKWTDYYASKYVRGHKLSIGPFDSDEIKALQKEAAKYDYGAQTGYVAMYALLIDRDSDIEYTIEFAFDKNFANGHYTDDDTLMFSVTRNGKFITNDIYEDILSANFDNNDGEIYLNLFFSSTKGINNELAECDAAGWALVAYDKTETVLLPLGNKKDNFTACDYIVENQENQGAEIKVVKHIKADGDDSEKKEEATEEEITNDISKLDIKVKNMTYTGKNRKPAITIKVGNKTLEKGKDYTVSYKNCKKIGTATVTIKGKGDYTGQKTIEYKIVPKKTTITSNGKKNNQATLGWTAIKGAEKYQIYCSTNGGKYKKIATVSGKKTSYTINGLDFKKNDYEFKIRSYATNNGKKYYSSYSKAVTIK